MAPLLPENWQAYGYGLAQQLVQLVEQAVANTEAAPTNLVARLGDSQRVARLREGRFSPGFLSVTLLAALIFGALHALQPGHGKTQVAA